MWVQAPAGLWDSVAAAIQAETPAAAAVPSLRDRRARRGSGGRITAWAAGLAVAAAAVGVGGYAAGGGFAPGPDSAFALSGTDNAPGATAAGALRHTPSGLEIELDVENLAPAPEGAYYQAWLKGAEGTVTIGTFHARRGGEDIVLWSGVEDVTRYETVTVTLQQEGGGPSSSGLVVLVGSV
ncbi:anti-sigma factor [Actinokineospora sp. 24-640]